VRRRVEEEPEAGVVDDAVDPVAVGTPHGGVWTREDHGVELVCAEHDLPVSGHR